MSHEQTEPAVYLDSVVSSGRDLTTSMGLLIDYCQEHLPAPVWEELRQLDYAADAEGLRNWLGALLLAEPPGADIEALWFGLQMGGVLEAPEGYVFYVAGSDRFDLRDPKWNQLPIYWPAGRKANSPVLEEMCRILEEAGGRVLVLGRYVLGLGYCCLAAATVCAAVDLRLLLGERHERHVAAGFDDGDYMVVGKADRDGWHRVTSPAEWMEAAAARPETSRAPTAEAGARPAKRKGGGLGRLLHAAMSAVYALAGIEPTPDSAPSAETVLGTGPANLSHTASLPAAAPAAPVSPAPASPAAQAALPGVAGVARELPARRAGRAQVRQPVAGLPAPEAMRVQAENAVQLARTQYQIELDYSEESLEKVEWILSLLYDDAHPRDRFDELMERVLGDWYEIYARYFPPKELPQRTTDSQLWQMARIWGAYVGEVMRARWNGQWAVERPTHGEAMVALRVQRSAVFPLVKVYERLASGPGENIWFFYRALKERFEVPV